MRCTWCFGDRPPPRQLKTCERCRGAGRYPCWKRHLPCDYDPNSNDTGLLFEELPTSGDGEGVYWSAGNVTEWFDGPGGGPGGSGGSGGAERGTCAALGPGGRLTTAGPAAGGRALPAAEYRAPSLPPGGGPGPLLRKLPGSWSAGPYTAEHHLGKTFCNLRKRRLALPNPAPFAA